MKTLETTKDRFEAIYPEIVELLESWGEMQRKMAGELLEALKDRPEEMYYIQNGYVGNSILWWAKDFAGYTTHFKKAGKYSKDEAIEIINNESKDDCAWSCWHVDHNQDAHVLTVEVGNLDTDFKITGKKI